MPSISSFPLRNLADIERFEAEKPFAERCGARSVYDVFAQSAASYPDQTALTMIMTGEADEAPREASYRELFEGITRAANFFHRLARPNPAVAFVLPHLIETHFVLWGAETAGSAVAVNFLLKARPLPDFW